MAECSGCAPGKCPKPDAPEWCNSTPFDPEGIVSSLNAIVTTVNPPPPFMSVFVILFSLDVTKHMAVLEYLAVSRAH